MIKRVSFNIWMIGLAIVLPILALLAYILLNPLAEASHFQRFESRATWTQPEQPHPQGWECWLLRDETIGENSPYLMWCDAPPGGKK